MIELNKIADYLMRLNCNKWGVISVILILFGAVYMGFIFPMTIKYIMKTQVRITPGTQGREIFEAVPFTLSVNTYFWNVTNPAEVMAGGKPNLQEVGPYRMDIWRYKADREDNDEDDSLTYDLRNRYIYRPDLNGEGLTGDEIITVAHPILLGMLLSVNVDREELLSFSSAAIDQLLDNPKDIFYRGTARKLLYEGVQIDCSKDEFESSTICAELRGEEYQYFVEHNETTLKFSIWGSINESTVARLKAKRGKENIQDLGNIFMSNDADELDAWYGDKCNIIKGTDGTIYPPFKKPSDTYTVFGPPSCRSYTAVYDGKVKYKGIKLSHYTFDFDTTNTEEPECWCRDEEHEYCPPKGIMDLFPCSGVPLMVSLPHFLNADPSAAAKVDGMNPDKSKHSINLELHQFSGALVQYAVRFQANFDIVPIESVEYMKDLRKMFLPLAWYEEFNDLNKKFTRKIKFQLVYVLYLQKFLKIICVLLGILGIVFAAVARYLQIDAGELPVKKNDVDLKTGPEIKTLEMINNDVNVTKDILKDK